MLMIKPYKMKEAVNRELDDFLVGRDTPCTRLTSGSRHGDNDIAEPNDAVCIGTKGSTFMERKRQHVRRTVDPTRPGIQLSYPLIVDERKGHLRPSRQLQNRFSTPKAALKTSERERGADGTFIDKVHCGR